MATIDAVFKPVNLSQSQMASSSEKDVTNKVFKRDEGFGLTTGKRARSDHESKKTVKKRRVENLNDSVEDFENSPVQKSSKPSKKSSKVKQMQKTKCEETKTSEKSEASDKSIAVTEMSYSDFLLSHKEESNSTGESTQITSLSKIKETSGEKSASVEKQKSRPSSDSTKSGTSQSSGRLVKSFLRWNKNAKTKIEPVSQSDDPVSQSDDLVSRSSDDPSQAMLAELPKNVVPSATPITNFFSKSDRPFQTVLSKSPTEIIVTADIHKEPAKKFFNIFDSKKRLTGLGKAKSQENHQRVVQNEKSVTNAITDDVECEIQHIGSYPITPVKKRKKRNVDCVETAAKNITLVSDAAAATSAGKGNKSNSDDKVAEIVVELEKPVMDKVTSAALAAQLKSLDEIKIDSKQASVQATLNFTSKGVMLSKPEKLREEPVTKPDGSGLCSEAAPKQCNQARKSKMSWKKASATEDLNISADAFECARTPKKKAALSSNERGGDVFVATIVKTPGAKKKKMPIKMKITRIREKNEVSRKKGAKLSKAQQLVQKAKTNNQQSQKGQVRRQKSQTKVNSSSSALPSKSSENLRRSSRRSAQVASCAISLSYEETPHRNKNSKKCELKEISSGEELTVTKTITPKKTSKKVQNKCQNSGKLPAAVKLAPMFLKKNKQLKKSESGSDCEVVAMTTSAEDAEAVKLRRNFLLSGVPESVKKKQAGVDTAAVCDGPPWPLVSHVQQSSTQLMISDCNIWSLPDAKLVCKSHQETGLADVNMADKSNWKTLVRILESSVPRTPVLGTQQQSKFEGDLVESLIKEMSSVNQSFPFKRMHKTLSTKLEAFTRKEPENKPKGKSKLRRKSKSRKSIEDQSVETDKPKANSMDAASLSWTEKYAPVGCAELFSNTAGAKKLRTWLADWKKKTDTELRRQMKLEIKQARRAGKSKDEIKQRIKSMMQFGEPHDMDFESGESDRFSDTADEDDDDDSLCNTMLVTGPHGSGKTAFVNALAQELGYKVFEVNASSKRNGKQVLSELQEATQSHQVSSKHLSTPANCKTTDCASDTQSKQTGSAIASMFKKAAAPLKANDKSLKKTSKGCETRKTAKESNGKKKNVDDALAPSFQKKGLELASVSLILFEEADIVLEEDKGFWSGVHSFMSTTKRPIVITASRPGFSKIFGGRFEEIAIRRPPIEHLTSYLQLVCLMEGFRTHYDDLCSLVDWSCGDLRQCCHILQWLLLSGGALCCDESPIVTKKEPSSLEQAAAPAAVITPSGDDTAANDADNALQPCSGEVNDGDDDFKPLMTKFLRRTRQTRVIDDDSDENDDNYSQVATMYSLTGSTVMDDDNSQQEQPSQPVTHIPMDVTCLSSVNNEAWVELVSADEAPVLHRLSFVSMMNTGVLSGAVSLQAIRNVLINRPMDLLELVKQCLCYRRDVLYANLPYLLPLPTTVTPHASYTADHLKVTHRSRIKNKYDMFDSENSDDDSGQPSTTNADDDSREKTSGDKLIIAQQSEPTKPDVVSCRILDSMSELCDSLSLADVMSSGLSASRNEFSLTLGHLLVGDLDENCCNEEPSQWADNTCQEICASIELLQVHKSHKLLQTDLEVLSMNSDRDRLNQMTLPVPDSSASLRLTRESASVISSGLKSVRAMRKVSEVLPLSTRCHPESVSCDYLPSIRNILLTEQLRLASGKKRRFLHYLDSMVQELKQSTVDVMCTSF